MELLSNAFVAAFLLGTLHALEVDHMIAVNAFVGPAPSVRMAASYGARWGLGHSTVVVFAGALLAWSGARLPPSFTDWGELAVGVALAGLGVWAFRAAQRFHLHRPGEHDGHGHLHAHPAGKPHHHHHHNATTPGHHGHLSTMMGALHGLAGTAPVVALIPVTMITDFAAALSYLVLFGFGTVVSMTLYASLAALAVRGLSVTTGAIQRLSRVIATATFAVGIWWIVRAVGSLTG